MNNVILAGRLVRDNQAFGSDDKLVIRNTIAVDGFVPKGSDKPSVDFVPLVAFGKTAAFLQKYTHKGTALVIRGRLHSGTYEKDGVKHSTLDVIVDNVEFGQGNKPADSAPAASTPASAPVATAPAPAANPAPASTSYEDEELPF